MMADFRYRTMKLNYSRNVKCYIFYRIVATSLILFPKNDKGRQPLCFNEIYLHEAKSSLYHKFFVNFYGILFRAPSISKTFYGPQLRLGTWELSEFSCWIDSGCALIVQK